MILVFSDRMSGYYFGTSPCGVQSEAIIMNGGAQMSMVLILKRTYWL